MYRRMVLVETPVPLAATATDVIWRWVDSVTGIVELLRDSRLPLDPSDIDRERRCPSLLMLALIG
jgi:hypothetical protein